MIIDFINASSERSVAKLKFRIEVLPEKMFELEKEKNGRIFLLIKTLFNLSLSLSLSFALSVFCVSLSLFSTHSLSLSLCLSKQVLRASVVKANFIFLSRLFSFRNWLGRYKNKNPFRVIKLNQCEALSAASAGSAPGKIQWKISSHMKWESRRVPSRVWRTHYCVWRSILRHPRSFTTWAFEWTVGLGLKSMASVIKLFQNTGL